MKFDIDKYADFLAKNAREGVIIENKILEWKLAELGLQSWDGYRPSPPSKEATSTAKES